VENVDQEGKKRCLEHTATGGWLEMVVIGVGILRSNSGILKTLKKSTGDLREEVSGESSGKGVMGEGGFSTTIKGKRYFQS